MRECAGPLPLELSTIAGVFSRGSPSVSHSLSLTLIFQLAQEIVTGSKPFTQQAIVSCSEALAPGTETTRSPLLNAMEPEVSESLAEFGQWTFIGFVRGLLQGDPDKRIGSAVGTQVRVKLEPYFSDGIIEAVAQGKVRSPFVPGDAVAKMVREQNLEAQISMHEMSPQGSPSRPVTPLSPSPWVLQKDEQAQFEGWEFDRDQIWTAGSTRRSVSKMLPGAASLRASFLGRRSLESPQPPPLAYTQKRRKSLGYISPTQQVPKGSPAAIVRESESRLMRRRQSHPGMGSGEIPNLPVC